MGLEDETYFPRGSIQKSRSSLKRKNQDQDDDLFKVHKKNDDKPKKRRRGGKKKSDAEPEEEDAVVIEQLSCKTITEGMILLGCIQEILEYELRVCLPGGIVGKVSIPNISDSYTNLVKSLAKNPEDVEAEIVVLKRLFRAGQAVACYVMSVFRDDSTDKTDVWLSLNPSNVNSTLIAERLTSDMIVQAAVSSIEDHGFVMDLGIGNLAGFLPSQDARNYCKTANGGNQLAVGQLIWCSPSASYKVGQRSVVLTCKPSVVDKKVVSEVEGLTLNSVLPGMVFETRVQDITEEGLVVSCFNFTGCLQSVHLKGPWDFPQNYTFQQTLQATVLYVHPHLKTIYFTLRGKMTPELYKGMFDGLSLGQIVEEAEVVAVGKKNVYFQLNDKVKAVVVTSHLSDDDIDDARDVFSDNAHYKCRIIAFNYMDQLAFASLKASVLEETYVLVNQLLPGTILKGTVKKLCKSGMVVKFSRGIQGFVHELHFADTRITKPEKFFEMDKPVLCRVLSVDHMVEPPRLHFTCKKSMVKSKLPVLASYDDASEGLVTDGVIVKVTDTGLLVAFYNNVKGWVPLEEINASRLSLEKLYFVGQSARCRIVNYDPSTDRLTLSLKLQVDMSAESEETETPKVKRISKTKSISKLSSSSCQVGSFYEVTVVKKKRDFVKVSLLSGEEGILPKEHLSDDAFTCSLLHTVFQPGDKISKVLCFKVANLPNFSRRTSFFTAAEENMMPRQLSDCQPGQLFIGVVKTMLPKGMLVELPGNITGFVPVNLLKDEFVHDTKASGFHVGQTVAVKVINVNLQNKTILLNTKMTDCLTSKFCVVQSLLSSVKDKLLVVRKWFRTKEEYADVASLHIGAVITVFVKNQGNCLVYEMSDGLEVIPVYGQTDFSEGQKIQAFVVDVDVKYRKVEVCVDEKVVKKFLSDKLEQKNRAKAYCTLLTVKNNYSVGILKSGHLCYIPSRKHFNDTHGLELEEETCVLVKVWRLWKEIAFGLFLKKVQNKDNSMGDNSAAICVKAETRRPRKDSDIEHTAQSSENNVDDYERPRTKRKKLKKLKKEESVVTTESVKDSSFAKKNLDSLHYSNLIHSEFISLPEENNTNQIKEESNSLVVEDYESGGLKVGIKYKATVQSIGNLGLNIAINDKIAAQVHITDLGVDCKDGQNPLLNFKPGTQIQVFVKEFSLLKSHRFLALSHRHAKLTPECSLTEGESDSNFQEGQMVKGYISHLTSEYVFVCLTRNITAKLSILNLGFKANHLPDSLKQFKTGNAISAQILHIDGEGIELSKLSFKSLYLGNIVTARVLSIRGDLGIFVRLPLAYLGTIELSNISDDYDEVENIMHFLLENRFVECFILEVNEVEKNCEVSVRKSRVSQSQQTVKDREILGIDDIQTGETLRGFVKYINPQKGCINIGHHLEASVKADFIPNSLKSYPKDLAPGTVVTGKVESIIMKTVMLRLLEVPLPSVQEELDRMNGIEPSSVRNNRLQTLARTHSQSSNWFDTDAVKHKSTDSQVSDTSAIPVIKTNKVHDVSETNLPSLNVSEGFKWDFEATPRLNEFPGNSLESSSSESEDEAKQEEKLKKKTYKQKLEERKKAELELFQTERLLMDSDREPESVDDFDRLVLAHPDSSIVWIKYIAFHLQHAEVDKARAVAERALKTVSFREEQEKMNLWVALLNLENLYGTQETLSTTFNRSLQYNEPVKMYSCLANMYIASSKMEQAEQLYNQMLKKFKGKKEIWIDVGIFYMRSNKLEMARQLLQKALKSLDQRLHIDVVSKFAQLEFKYGDAERGRTMLESVISNYPKRTDLWSVYIDLLTKREDISGARKLYERVVSLKLSPKKMRAFFKRWLEFEKKHGNEGTVKLVKAKAVEYVEAKTSFSSP